MVLHHCAMTCFLTFDGDARVSFFSLSGMTEDDKKESNNEVTVERDDNMLKVTVGFSLLVASPYRGIHS